MKPEQKTIDEFLRLMTSLAESIDPWNIDENDDELNALEAFLNDQDIHTSDWLLGQRLKITIEETT